MKRCIKSSIAFALLTLMFMFTVTNAAAPVGLDVNDVSVLFPLKNQKPWPEINLANDKLLSPEVFKQILLFESPNSTLDDITYLDARSLIDMSRWYVTSFRFDTCGEVFDLSSTVDPVTQEKLLLAKQGPGCQPRLRLVIQPFNLFGNPLATAIHLLYKIDPTEIPSVFDWLSIIKSKTLTGVSVDTTGLPLVLHPGLAAEAMAASATPTAAQKELADTVRSGILNLLSARRSSAFERIEIVTLNVEVEIDHWKLVGGYVQNNTWNRFVTEFSKQFNDASNPAVRTGVEDLRCDRFAICKLLPSPTLQPAVFSPAGTVVTEIFQDRVDMRDQQVPGLRTKEIQTLAEIVDNPKQTHFFNTNCVSCHQSSNLRDRSKLHTDLGIPDSVTPFVPDQYLRPLSTNVINFGYFGAIPRISTRTAADSVVVADALNRLIGVSNPSTKAYDLETLWKCVVSAADFKSCL